MFFFALIVFSYAAITDGLDGLLARYFNQYSVLGAYLDPLADKLLLSSAYVCLGVLGVLPGWLTVIVITRDILIMVAIAVFAITNIEIDMNPSLASKWTTVAQLCTVIWVLLDPSLPGAEIVIRVLIWSTAALTIFSGLHYTYVGMNVIQDSSNNRE